ncbi:hypothetical protein [Haloplanus natans]|uniref:hypothetical protein n=1 Tax=Haloplanus natans TaxID=376171 RepID=UPI000677B041|nr:hypothetical protein [Haloplanus natans]
MFRRFLLGFCSSTELFDQQNLIGIGSTFAVVFVFLNWTRFVLARLVLPEADLGRMFFPVGVGVMRFPSVLAFLFPAFDPFPRYHEVLFTPKHAVIAVIAWVVVLGAVSNLERFEWVHVYLLCVSSTVLTTLIQGFKLGFLYPLTGLRNGRETHYFQDAATVESAYGFVANFNRIQPDLFIHARGHPPGAVLLYYVPRQVISHPVFTGLVILLVAAVSSVYTYLLLEEQFNHEIGIMMASVFVLLPAVQVYFYTTLDAVVACLVIVTVYHYVRWQSDDNLLHYVAAVLATIMLFSITFLSVFVLGVVGLHQLDRLRDGTTLNFVRQLSLFTLPIAAAMGAIYLLTGFNYVTSFLTASAIESAKYGGGFYATTAPVSYVTTRIENVLGIVLFFGPYCGYIAYKGARLPTNGITDFGWYGMLTIVVLFLAGTPRTGETARICLFLLPFLLLFVGNYFHHRNLSFTEGKQLAALVWLQAVCMQLFGNYLW